MCVLGGRVSEIAKPMKEMCHMQLCFKDTPATDWAQLFPDASRDAMDLLSQLGQWNPGQCPEVLHSAWEQTLLHQVRVKLTKACRAEHLAFRKYHPSSCLP